MAEPVIHIESLRRSCAQCSLRALCLPANIGGDDMLRLDRIVRGRRPLRRGESLFRAGQPLGALFVVREGAFKTVAPDLEGESQVIGFHLPGELIGLDAVGDGRHGCEAVALTQSSVCEVPFRQLEDIAAQVPGLQRQLLRVIGRSIHRDQSHIETLGRRSAQERMALFLHQLAGRFRALGRSGERLRLPMSREEIASYLGLVIETVSRTLGKMQDDGIISVQGREVRILDGERLGHAAHERGAVRAVR